MVLKKNKTGKIWIIQDQKMFYFLPFFFNAVSLHKKRYSLSLCFGGWLNLHNLNLLSPVWVNK